MSIISETAEQRGNRQNLQAAEAADELARKNFSFVQVQKSALRELRSLIAKSPMAAQLLAIMVEKMNRQNGLMISMQTLSEITGHHRASVGKALKTLAEDNWIQVVKVGKQNAYLVNAKAFWQADGVSKRYATFSAQIIASEKEQDTPLENWEGVQLKHFPFVEKEERMLVLNTPGTPPDQGEIELE